jgi:hypothetical protein
MLHCARTYRTLLTLSHLNRANVHLPRSALKLLAEPQFGVHARYSPQELFTIAWTAKGQLFLEAWGSYQ